MTNSDQDFAMMARALEQSGEYRVLRRLAFRQHFSTPTEPTKVGILLDVETTGLDTGSDEVVELGTAAICRLVTEVETPRGMPHRSGSVDEVTTARPSSRR